MFKQLTRQVKKHPLTWFYAISVLIEIAIIPIFIFTGAEDGLFKSLEKAGIEFNEHHGVKCGDRTVKLMNSRFAR